LSVFKNSLTGDHDRSTTELNTFNFLVEAAVDLTVVTYLVYLTAWPRRRTCRPGES